MGISNTSELLLTEECSFLSRPLLDFQQGSQLQSDHHQEIITKHQEFTDKFKGNLVSSLEIKLPISLSGAEIKVEEEENDGCKTPTTLDQKIPLMMCPPAPRKAKPMPSKKRKASSCQGRILLDFSSEVEAMFPANVLADFGRKIKKVRSAN